jgi:3-hydroxyacyl-CoA dehydrogenase / enoyl-CoA hydratase / 3-hydroxybutyryl-CoA epimerase
MTADLIRREMTPDGLVLLVIDDTAHSANTMRPEMIDALQSTVDGLAADPPVGVIVTSAKKSFFAGADLETLIQADRSQATRVYDEAARLKAVLRRLETLGRPVVAVINGSALGGGLEIALACHHRVALDAPGVEIGLPEVTLGLLPGGGGVVRTVRLLGLMPALTEVLLRGQRHRPAQALEVGLVHDVVSTVDEAMAAARRYIVEHPNPRQPWDEPGYRMPGGTPASRSLAALLPAFPAHLRKELKGAPYPAPHHILCAAVEGAQVDLATALDIEGRYFTELACGQVAKNMTKAFFFDLRAAGRAAASSGAAGQAADAEPARRVAVLGAGMMGAGIAFVCARAGMDVVLRDVTAEAAQRGIARYARPGREGILARIRPTADDTDLAGCDLVIEAVFEDADLKRRLFGTVEAIVAGGALLASNTSTLPITELAGAVNRPQDFVGLHFFSPVEKMPLVEVIRGGKTGDAALRRALAVVRQLGKTPIVVNDSRGFFTSRVIGTFLNEGVAMLAEGIPAASIEQATSQAGYPTPVLALVDELTLTLIRRIREQTRAATGGGWVPHPADAIIDAMIDEYGRPGRAAGAGFYEYVDGKRDRLWPGLAKEFGRGTEPPAPFADLPERLLFIEAIEAVKCLGEGVVTAVPDANIGSILGIGYPGWTGGVLQYINQYRGGLHGFVARARELADRYGARFTPPPSLVDRAERGEVF